MKNTGRGPLLTRGRAAVFDALRGQPDPVDIQALSQATARHPNTVREQLGWLVEHGYVTRIRQPSADRGRPAWLYQARGARPGEDDYVELAAALAWQLQDDTPASRAQAEEAGRQWAGTLTAERPLSEDPSPAAGRRYAVELLDDLGYAPSADADAHEVVLARCPLLQAAHRFPEIVCAVHLGVVGAALEHGGAPSDEVELVPFSAPGECRLRLGGGAATQPGNASA